jgi:hypothetical protein
MSPEAFDCRLAPSAHFGLASRRQVAPYELAQLGFDLRHSVDGVGRFAQQDADRAGQCAQQGTALKRGHQRFLEAIEDVGRELVELPPVARVEAASDTRELECEVTWRR